MFAPISSTERTPRVRSRTLLKNAKLETTESSLSSPWLRSVYLLPKYPLQNSSCSVAIAILILSETIAIDLSLRRPEPLHPRSYFLRSRRSVPDDAEGENSGSSLLRGDQSP